MAGPGDIRGKLPPGLIHRPLSDAGGEELGTAEQKKVKADKAKAQAAKNAGRLAQQAGFGRVHGARKRGVDLGDSANTPIPLPGDDVDPDAWEQQALDDAQAALSSSQGNLEEVLSELAAERPLGEALLGASFMPSEADLSRLQAIVGRLSDDSEQSTDDRDAAGTTDGRPSDDDSPFDLQTIAAQLGDGFGVELPDGASLGDAIVSAGIVVSGEAAALGADCGGASAQNIVASVRTVTKKCNQAVERAQKLNKGIGIELSQHRTMVFKR